MTYPLSTDVTAGQPTAAAHYNNLRRDALHLGNADVDSKDMANFLNRHAEHMSIEYLATNRVRVPYSINKPPTLMINGYMLQLAANADLPSGQFTGAAATWYIFAVRSAGSTSFTLAVNTSAAEATDQRLIGEVYWDGSALSSSSIKCYFQQYITGFPTADYDSGWFAVSAGTTYTKAHSLGVTPRFHVLLWSASSTGSGDVHPVYVIYSTSPASSVWQIVTLNNSNVVVITGTGSACDVDMNNSTGGATSGYYRILAWK